MSSRFLTGLFKFSAPRLSSMAGHSHHDGPANRLAKEKSPYLLQHAHNPVDWHPWGEEAFQIAKEKNLPVFLSVGYSTCHWCHVMERESFVDPQIAKLMNENFINIKLDREERPDVDKLYMAFVVSIVGHGGWPMSVFLTPEGDPLTGGTYFAPQDSFGHLGFSSILKLVSEQWNTNNASVLAQGKALSKAIQRELASKPGEAPSANHMIQNTYQHLVSTFDEDFGGFGMSMKFPKPVDLEFLLYYFKHNSETTPGQFALNTILEKTLHGINQGGIHDHLGKGFHRYAVDKEWKIPHYEKMLYDQGQLLSVFSNYYKLTGKYHNVIEDIIEYVKTDLLHQEGGFCSAEDAESYPIEGAPKKKEGAFYVWTEKELKDALTTEQFNAFKFYFNIQEDGNCPSGADPRGELRSKNTLFIGLQSPEVVAEELKISKEELMELIEEGKKTLLKKRDERPRPGLDNKIITSWNSLMISGLATAFSAFPEKKEYLEMAQKAVKFLKKYLVDDQDRLLRTAYSDGDRKEVVQISKPILAFSDDYSFLIQALLDLYEVDFDEAHLEWAIKLQTEMDEHFFDSHHKGGYFNSRDSDSTIFARLQEDQDGAEPCANSVATSNLLRLSDIFGNKEFRKKAGAIFDGHATRLKDSAYALPKMVIAANRYASSATQIVVVSPRHDDEMAQQMLKLISTKYLPDKSVIYLSTATAGEMADVQNHEFLLKQNPDFLQQLEAGKDSAAVFICENFTCSLPIRSLGDLKNRLEPKPSPLKERNVEEIPKEE